VSNTVADPNLPVYNRPDVAAHYAALNYLTPCEQILFQTYLANGIAVLDLGVGGGRTTPYLSALARRYVGLDYAEEMIASCRRRYPGLEFQTTDATDLSQFADGSFDAVVMAFNGMDYVIPDESRLHCLREIKRILADRGVLIFSSHNPRAILVRPSWNRQRVEALAKQTPGRSSILFRLLVGGLIGVRALAAFARATASSLVRAAKRLPTRAFWRGEGHLLDPAHGGLRTHCAVPNLVEREISSLGFQLVRVLGDDYPRPSFEYATDWYYYVFTKAECPPKDQPCA
jgi:SAM-dependent methyltransferase